jgi:hypothetical protein
MTNSAGLRTLSLITAAAVLVPVGAASAGDDLVPRRDGSKAVAAPADLDAAQTSPDAGSAFDWGDAGLGAAAGALTVAFGAAGMVTLRGRPRRAAVR